MKYILTLLIGFVVIEDAQAQTIGLFVEGTPTDVSGTIVDVAGGEETYLYFDVVNETASTLLLGCTRTKLQTVAGASDYLCWGKDAGSGLCYPEFTVGPLDPWTTPDEFSWAPADTGLLQVYHVANGNPGVAMYRYFVIDDSGALLDSVDVRYTSTVGISTNESISISSYPNPATDNLFVEIISSTPSDNYFLNLYNVMGSEIIRQNLTEGKNIINVSELTKGVYFYTILRNDRAVETKKVVIN